MDRVMMPIYLTLKETWQWGPLPALQPGDPHDHHPGAFIAALQQPATANEFIDKAGRRTAGVPENSDLQATSSRMGITKEASCAGWMGSRTQAGWA
jgi:hypothetical protein